MTNRFNALLEYIFEELLERVGATMIIDVHTIVSVQKEILRTISRFFTERVLTEKEVSPQDGLMLQDKIRIAIQHGTEGKQLSRTPEDLLTAMAG